MSTPDRDMVKAAADAVYRAWLKHIGEAGAREQAQAFASRFRIDDNAVPA